MPDATKTYLSRLEKELKVGNATEHTHRATLSRFLEELSPRKITITNEAKRIECGAPDLTLTVQRPRLLPLGYVETKDVDVSLSGAERTEQLKRYRKSLPNLILTDYLEFRWYVNGEKRATGQLAALGARGKLTRDEAGETAALELLEAFLKNRPDPISSPRVLAERMAQLTHMIRDMVGNVLRKNMESDMLGDLRKAFAQVLIPDLDQPENIGQFADMYAQTITYGLFAARCTDPGKRDFRRLGAERLIPKTNPFLRTLFGTITGSELDDEPYAGFVDDLAQLLAHADMPVILEEFGARARGKDPVVHFYETFLTKYDPSVRERRGVYYTPEPVVDFIVRSVDRILKDKFGLADGLADTSRIEHERKDKNGKVVKESSHRVLILDPACGTGTFLYRVVHLIRKQFMERNDAGMWSGYVRDNLLPRLFGFELLMAPYAVAHFKMGMELAARDLKPSQQEKWAYDFASDERLHIYLTNTLEETERRVQELMFGLLRAISEEAGAAARIKKDMPIMVILGNPPYSGHSANRSWKIEEIYKDGRGKKPGRYVKKKMPTFIGKLIQGYHQVDGEPLGEKNPKWLQADYVKFIRWAQWRIHRTGAGILAFITNHAYLDNPTCRGMRQQLMETFDEIHILDLHGNLKKKETAPGGSKDENVFDIQQGVSICMMVKMPRESAP